MSAFLWAFWPGLVSLVETWESDPDYNHGFLVVPISLWLLWQRRDQLEALDLKPSWWGAAVLGAAACLRWFGAEFFISQFEVWSIPLWVAGTVLLFGGWQLLKWSGGAIAFLWFMTPLPASMTDFVSLPLQKLSAVISTWTLHLFAQPAVRSGTTISLGEHILEVERACSGLRIVYGILALAVAYVLLARPRLLRGIVLMMAAVPIAVLANSARVTVTGLLFLVVSGEKAHQYAHDFAGLLMLPLAVTMLWLFHLTMDKFIRAFETSGRAGSMLVLKTSLTLLVVSTGLVLWQQRQEDAAVETLLNIAERHETDAQRLQKDNNIEESVKAWALAGNVLERYYRLRPENAGAAKRQAVAFHRVASAVNRPGPYLRAARSYQRAWALQPDDTELGFEQARLAIAGRDFSLALTATDELLKRTTVGGPEQLTAFRLKVQAQLQDADQPVAKTSWNDVVQTLQQGISEGLDPVTCAYQLAVLYRLHPVDSVGSDQRETAAEQVIDDMLRMRLEDPQAWFARWRFRTVLPAPTTIAPANPESDATPEVVRAPDQSPDEDLDRAITLAAQNVTAESHALWLTAGTRAQERKEYDQARKYFENALKANPDHFLGWLELARLKTGFHSTGNRPKDVTAEQRQAAIDLLKQGLAQEQLTDELLLQIELITQQLQSTNSQQVTEANQRIVDLKAQFEKMSPEIGVPLQLELAVVESQIQADAGDLVKASRVLDSVLTSKEVEALKPENGLLSRAWLTLGGYYERQSLNDKATFCFERATTLEPDSIPTAMHQALMAERVNNSSAAADLYEDVAKRLQNRPEPFLALARNELRQQLSVPSSQQDLSRVTDALAQASSLGAPEVDVALIASDVAAVTGGNAAALPILENAASKHPDASQIWQLLALRRQAAGDKSGAAEALSHYQSTVGDPLKATQLETDLLVRSKDSDGAERVLTEAIQKTDDVSQQRQLYGQLTDILVSNGRVDAAQKHIEEFAKLHPSDVAIQVQLANVYWAAQRLDLMEQTEQQLKKLEGEKGGFWNELRARRLVEMARKTEDMEKRNSLLAEAKTAIEQPISLTVNGAKAQVLLGRIAIQKQLYADAARHLEAAWAQGQRSVSTASELIFALQSSGASAKVESYLEQVQAYLPLSPQLFDMALQARSKASFADLKSSTELAQSWVDSIADANSFLRLARTLQLEVNQREPQRTQQLQRIETAYRKALELNPNDPQSWGEFLRFLYRDQNEPERAISELSKFTKNPNVPDLDRSFVSAQLLSEFNLQQQAARAWNDTVELALKNENVQTKNRVLLLAARYFFGKDTPRAVALARQAVALDPANIESLRLLGALLSDKKSEASLNETVSLLKTYEKATGQTGNASTGDIDNRIMAALLFRQFDLLPSDAKAADNLREAAELLQKLTDSTEADSVQLGRILAAQGDKQAALLAFDESARRTTASVPTVRAFVEYWQDNFADTDTLSDRVEQVLQTLETTRGRETVALDLRLRPKSVDREKVDEIVGQFLKTVVTTQSSEAAGEILLEQIFALLAVKGRQDLSLKILSEDLSPVTNAQKLNALLLVTITAPVAADFEASLNSFVESQGPVLNDAKVDRAAADFYFMRGNWSKAEEYYRKCLQRDPREVQAANNLALVVVELRSDFMEAERLIQQGLAVMAENKSPEGRDTFLLDTKAQVLLTAGRTDEAIKILEPLAQSVAADSSVFLHLAACFQKTDKTVESKEAFATAQKLGIDTAILPPMDKRLYESLKSAPN